MSNVNIIRAVENIRTGTTVYTPIVEVIVNAIQAIESNNEGAGQVDVIIERSSQTELENKISPVENFVVKDNGVGFTDENRKSFDTLYSDYKISQGGKGFGRFTCLKYFNDLKVDSIYKDGDAYKKRTFKMGKGNDIIVNEKIEMVEASYAKTIVKLCDVKEGKFVDKKLSTIARVLAERLLPYFIAQDYSCPKITLLEDNSSERIVLNDFVSNQLAGVIKEIPISNGYFSLSGSRAEYEFSVRLFKFYSPKQQISKVSLVAHRREVTDTAIHKYVPEFIEEFYDKDADGIENKERNYIIKAYVFGGYLDDNVSLERGGFDFQKRAILY